MNRRMRPGHGFCLIMKRMRNMIGLVLFSMALLGGCTSNVRVNETFPVVVAEPRDMNAVLVMNREFRTYQASPNEKTNITLGPSQVDLMTKAFSGLFARVTVVSSKDQIGPGVHPARARARHPRPREQDREGESGTAEDPHKVEVLR